MLLHGHTHRERPSSRSGLILSLYGALSLIALLVSAGRDDVDIYRIEGTSTVAKLCLSPLLGLAVGLAVVLLSRLAVRRYAWARRLHRGFRGILGHLGAREIAVLAVASAVGEELLFRGALQPIIGLWPQAVVFALLHIGPGWRYWPWTLWALGMGLVFGVMFQATGDLGGPIVAHFTINFLNLSFIAKVALPPEGDATGSTPATAKAPAAAESSTTPSKTAGFLPA